ncbi:MAG: hypothetical protein WC712_03920 [Candidatus Brocadiia bacterium]
MEAMNLDNVVGSMIMLKIDNWRELEPFGIEGEQIYARCVGVGDFGIWIENPAFESAPVTAGAPESALAYILIAWSFVKAVVYFPDMEEGEFQVKEEVKKLGFK